MTELPKQGSRADDWPDDYGFPDEDITGESGEWHELATWIEEYCGLNRTAYSVLP